MTMQQPLLVERVPFGWRFIRLVLIGVAIACFGPLALALVCVFILHALRALWPF